MNVSIEIIFINFQFNICELISLMDSFNLFEYYAFNYILHYIILMCRSICGLVEVRH